MVPRRSPSSMAPVWRRRRDRRDHAELAGPPLAPGHQFTNWTILRHVADGSLASVYQARYTGLRVNEMPAVAALKITGPLLAADRERLPG